MPRVGTIRVSRQPPSANTFPFLRGALTAGGHHQHLDVQVLAEVEALLQPITPPAAGARAGRSRLPDLGDDRRPRRPTSRAARSSSGRRRRPGSGRRRNPADVADARVRPSAARSMTCGRSKARPPRPGRRPAPPPADARPRRRCRQSSGSPNRRPPAPARSGQRLGGHGLVEDAALRGIARSGRTGPPGRRVDPGSPVRTACSSSP